MKFDVVIIGGGLSGLSCGIHLAEHGKNCAIITSGQSVLSFFSGSLDFLNNLPDGRSIEFPLDALCELNEQAPKHPYSTIGTERVTKLALEAESLLKNAGLFFKGTIQGNHQRITSLGSPRATWLSLRELATFNTVNLLPWKNIAVIGIEGFLDFQPEIMTTELMKLGIQTTTAYLSLSILDKLRTNNSEFRAVNIAWELDRIGGLDSLLEELQQLSMQTDAIILPACMKAEIVEQLSYRLAKPVMLVPTLPPSLLGIRIHQQLHHRFQQLGGVIMSGDTVIGGEFKQNQVVTLNTHNHFDIPLATDQVVLASGRFFSNGLLAKSDGIYEPIFGLDIESKPLRGDWTKHDFFDAQPYQQFGVKTDEQFRTFKEGRPIKNLYAIGAVLAGFDALKLGCGSGVSLISALQVADTILNKQKP